MTEGHQLLERHIALFNQGVRTGDFGPMLAPFAPDATLTFVGIPVGPFHGKAAIAACSCATALWVCRRAEEAAMPCCARQLR
ncbi:MAG: nuclear transport factor 2 family protein [Chloroflexia bacterium]